MLQLALDQAEKNYTNKGWILEGVAQTSLQNISYLSVHECNKAQNSEE